MENTLTVKESSYILRTTGADEIRMVDRNKLKPEIIESAYKYEYNGYRFTDPHQETYHNVRLAKYCFGAEIGPEIKRMVVNVIKI